MIFKSNERSEDSYIGLADFFFRKKSKLMHLGIYTLFGFNLNSSDKSDVNSALQIRTWKLREKKPERF